ncbi:MAG: hypothetical protein HFH68_01370 [Lachnospiraceae bacterium]|nr:hypothetical protein [Lachnospiraceae bacterium]
MEKKYEFTGLEKEAYAVYRNVIVRQIRAVRSFGGVKKGDVGGWIGMEYNLSHGGNAWVKDNAVVIDDSVVCGDALVAGNAVIEEGSVVSGNAVVCGYASIIGSKIHGNAKISGCASVENGAEITDNAIVCGNASVEPNACVYGNAEVCGCGRIPSSVAVGGSTKVYSYDFNNDCADSKIIGWLSIEMDKINCLRNIVNYWIFAGLPPYGFEKKDFSSPLEFRKTVENFILDGAKGFKDAIAAYYCEKEAIDPPDWLDCDGYSLSPDSIPLRLFYYPEGWKGRRSANPVISKADALREVKRNGLLLRWVKEQTPEICMAAVKRNGEALQWVKEQTPELCAAAMLENLGAERYAEWKPDYKEPESDENGFVSFNESMFAMEESLKAVRMVKVCC